jgi:hypothetical protein
VSSPHPQGDAAALTSSDVGPSADAVASQQPAAGFVTALAVHAIICSRSLFARAIGIDKQSCHLSAGRNIALTPAELKPS